MRLYAKRPMEKHRGTNSQPKVPFELKDNFSVQGRYSKKSISRSRLREDTKDQAAAEFHSEDNPRWSVKIIV